ncbi:MAG: hypothetical protein LIO90_03415 [Bacteroidales bacterium]|nr:hypothetical protein [Bacteroidales bacterium]
MNRLLLLTLASSLALGATAALPKALYVKKGDNFQKYSFGVAEDLRFSSDGNILYITGYGEGIQLSDIDYITFEAPVDELGLTPDQQKQRLVDIGQKCFDMVDLDQHAKLIKTIDYFCQHYASYKVPDEYYDIYDNDFSRSSSYSAMVKALRALKAIAQGNGAASRAATNAAVDIWKAEDFFGVYEPQESPRRHWERTSTDIEGLQVNFTDKEGAACTFLLTTSDPSTDWIESDFTCRIPSHVKVTLTRSEELLASVDIDFTVDNEAKSLAIDLTAQATNYAAKVTSQTTIDNYGISENVKVMMGNDVLATCVARLNGVNLTDYERWRTEMEESTTDDEYYDEANDEWVWIKGDRQQLIANHFINASAVADVIGELQLYGRISKLYYVFETMDAEEEDLWDRTVDPDKGTITYDDPGEKAKILSVVNCLNNYCDVTFYYDGSSQQQGHITFDLFDDIDSWYTSGYWDEEADEWVEEEMTCVEHYYELQPILTFPDLTGYAINGDEYFNKTNFGDLVTSYDDLIDTYEKIVDSEDDDDK